MRQTWPPSPRVEDEEVALAREVIHDGQNHSNENQPAGSRGSVNQYPIILDSDEASESSSAENGTISVRPETVPKPVANAETRFVLVQTQSSESELETSATREPLHRSKSTTQLRQRDGSRGRPHVTRIQTDVGAGLDGVRTGQRRNPSPYSHTPAGTIEALVSDQRPQNGLLSPMHAHEARRPVSAHPKSHTRDRDSSDSDHEPKPRRSERSRSRAARQSFSHSDRSDSDKLKRSRSTKRNDNSETKFDVRAHRYRSPAPRPGGFSGYAYTGHEHITPPTTPKPTNDSARSSATDQHIHKEHARNRYEVRGVNTESPNTSSAEESHARHLRVSRSGESARTVRSRRGSRARDEADGKPSLVRARSQHRERPSKDESFPTQTTSDEQIRRGSKTPISARTPVAMESMLESAFAANQNKHLKSSGTRSRQVSPCASPTQSPPHTPRGDRSLRDYFEQTYPALKPPKPRSRPPSVDENNIRDLKNVSSTLLGVATLGASLAAKAIPSLSRSTTSQSLETPSSSSQSRPSSGQRSRRPSPLLEEPQPVYQTLSRMNSVTGHENAATKRTTTYAVHEDGTVPKTGQYTPPLPESPRVASRASSYSHSSEQPRPPALLRAYSTTTTQGYQQSYQIASQQPLLPSPINVEPNNFAASPARPNTLPPCPRSKPVAGLHDWYTIRDMSFLAFCPTCMNFLGATRYRDYFIPSHGKDPHQPTTCAMSYPWLRVAWLQSIKQDRKDLNLIWSIACGPPKATKPCAGNKIDLRRWYHLEDPRTKKPVGNFDICSACVRNIDMIFPRLQFVVFDRQHDKKEVERICNLNTHSRHFASILGELERLSDRSKEEIRSRDKQDFVEYIRRISRNRQCVKDTLLATQSWHFIPELPEFTICEECYEEVVWPIRDRPIARDVSKTLKILPTMRKGAMLQGTSCQLYSERMRRVFQEAVSRNDFGALKQAAQYRYHMEHRLQEMHKLYEMDHQAGIDRRAEIEKNIGLWQSIA